MDSPVIRFVLAVVNHWATLMTGGAVMAVLLVYERYTRHEVPVVAFWVVAAVFVVIAMYLAWHERDTAATNLQRALDDRTRRRVIRERLASFAGEGRAYLSKTAAGPEVHVADWIYRVEKYLRDELDFSYGERFNISMGSAMMVPPEIPPVGEIRDRWCTVQSRLMRLEQFMAELGDRPVVPRASIT